LRVGRSVDGRGTPQQKGQRDRGRGQRHHNAKKEALQGAQGAASSEWGVTQRPIAANAGTELGDAKIFFLELGALDFLAHPLRKNPSA
jgi:hypothetical protein